MGLLRTTARTRRSSTRIAKVGTREGCAYSWINSSWTCSELEERLQDAASRDAAQIVVAIDRNGTAVIVDLLVDGAPILE